MVKIYGVARENSQHAKKIKEYEFIFPLYRYVSLSYTDAFIKSIVISYKFMCSFLFAWHLMHCVHGICCKPSMAFFVPIIPSHFLVHKLWHLYLTIYDIFYLIHPLHYFDITHPFHFLLNNLLFFMLTIFGILCLPSMAF